MTTAAAQHRPHETAKETIESIVVALILAFVFCAFIVEAFVIPTGSMAPTLYGAHGTILCKDCGTEFAYGLRDLSDRRRAPEVKSTDSAYCPNCRAGNTNLKINDLAMNPESGDRILVLKWPFDLGIDRLGPRRWDVTVFKDPSDGTTNFIKRLVGLPDEVLMIVDGDVYTAPTERLSEETLNELDGLRKEKYAIRAGMQAGRLRPTPRFVLDELDEKVRIVRKTLVAQQSLWLPAYDHDLPPHTDRLSKPRWAPVLSEASGWEVSGRRFVFEPRGGRDDRIVLQGQAIGATCAYNLSGGGNAPSPKIMNRPTPPFVHDQRVRFVLTSAGADGAVVIRLKKNKRVFDARIGFDGLVSIVEKGPRATGGALVALETRVASLVPGRPAEVSFENVDYRLTLRINGRTVLQSNDDPESSGYYAPNLAHLRRVLPGVPSRPAIIGEGGGFALSHVAVARDVHYYLDPMSNGLRGSWPRTGWGSKESPILLRGHEYFMLGDNTAASKDSRLWDVLSPGLQARGEQCQLGTVPRDQLIGKAFFVYWPSMQRVAWLDWLPKFRRWGIVPDVGRMRWIR